MQRLEQVSQDLSRLTLKIFAEDKDQGGRVILLHWREQTVDGRMQCEVLSHLATVTRDTSCAPADLT